MGCFVVVEFLLTSASCGPSAIAEPLVTILAWGLAVNQLMCLFDCLRVCPSHTGIVSKCPPTCPSVFCRSEFLILSRLLDGNLHISPFQMHSIGDSTICYTLLNSVWCLKHLGNPNISTQHNGRWNQILPWCQCIRWAAKLTVNFTQPVQGIRSLPTSNEHLLLQSACSNISFKLIIFWSPQSYL